MKQNENALRRVSGTLNKKMKENNNSDRRKRDSGQAADLGEQA